ncbi:unnamed protein product [Colias eurytheme]|nr:unnamed protein product [Colias eurytheme]
MRLVMPGCVSHVRSVPALRVLVLIMAMALYLSMGATVFQAIEGPVEKAREERVEMAKSNFLRDHPSVTGILPF